MKVSNAAVTDDDTVPSARAERRRVMLDNVDGVLLYTSAVAAIAIVLLVVVGLA